MSDYITSDQLKATLELSGETYADADIATAISSASRSVDAYKDTKFYASASTAIREYTADPHDCALPIDDLNALTSLNVDMDGDGVFEETWVADTDFYLEPRNADQDGRPYDQISIRLQSGKVWPTWQYAVQVEGSFGWATAPAGVIQATTILAGRYLKRARETPYGIVTIGTDALAAARLGKIDPDVAFLLDNLDADAPTLIL